MRVFWLSFCDCDRPEGQQFLGACIVEARNIVDAAKKAWDLGINPGGEAMGLSLSLEDAEICLAGIPRETLLQKNEIPDPISWGEIQDRERKLQETP